jgi:hypothetical protein
MFGFKGLGWFVGSVAVAIISYMATSQGSVERARLEAVEASIIAAKKEIRTLETEFDTRANLAQLGEWNGSILKLAAPAPNQYLPDEQALANLDSPAAEAELQVATLVVPAGTPKPLPEAASPEGDKPGAAGTAQRDGLAKARTQAVAMLDDKLFDDLKKRAQAEQLALR